MLRGWRVLVVEDDSMIAWALCDALEDVGAWPVGPAASVADAISIMSCESVDAAILDITLATEDTSVLAHRFLDVSLPFLFYTGTSSPTFSDARLANVPLLQKPVDAARVVRRLAETIGPESE